MFWPVCLQYLWKVELGKGHFTENSLGQIVLQQIGGRKISPPHTKK